MNRPHPKPTDEDRKNYSSDDKPQPDIAWSKDQRVRAKFRIFDSPGHETDDWGWVSAENGEMGTVVYVDDDGTPTVRFDDTGCSTCVSNHEVGLVDLDLERYALNSFFLGITSRLAWGRGITPNESYKGTKGSCFAAGFEVAEAYLNDIAKGKVSGLGLSDIIGTALRNLNHEKL